MNEYYRNHILPKVLGRSFYGSFSLYYLRIIYFFQNLNIEIPYKSIEQPFMDLQVIYLIQANKITKTAQQFSFQNEETETRRK
jgi:hypothetical protein